MLKTGFQHQALCFIYTPKRREKQALKKRVRSIGCGGNLLDNRGILISCRYVKLRMKTESSRGVHNRFV